ncbi:MAG: Si-specific NAD(P)(+) transhydrogenase [Deltaproteobacteria bacterium]|nr:Si-specific NAD(P)(+) transhydrogenase [Deltaproteobacteria bacterium]
MSKQENGTTHQYDYDLLVIGCGPAGQRSAVQAAKIRKKVAIIDAREVVGGVCVNLGTIPSKSFREAVLFLSGFRQRNIYGSAYRVKSSISMDDLNFRCNYIMQTEIDTIDAQLARNRVEVLHGTAIFKDSHTLEIRSSKGVEIKTAEKFVIAVGARPHRPKEIEFDGKTIFDSDDLLTMKEVPRTMTVVGGGVIGIEYASMFAALGCAVTVIDGRDKLLEFIDHEIIDSLIYRMRSTGVQIKLGETVKTCARREDNQVVTTLNSGKVIVSDVVLFSAGRESATANLGLEHVGIELGPRGKLIVDQNYKTTADNIYAAGDVIGFPALASTSAEQGRQATCHAYGIETANGAIPLPYGIYSIPEIAMVGQNERELTQKETPYEIGIARYSENTRGDIVGDREGMLKIIFHRETGKLLGTHIIGEGATELIHLGQSVIAFGGGLDYLMQAVFNYPTLTSCYKTAALDGYNKLRAQGVKI